MPEQKRRTILIDGFPIDATIEETHSHESEVTSYPTESGANLTDHIRPLPIVVTIRGLVSDTPIGEMEILRDLEGSGESQRPSEAARLHLLEIRNRRQPVSIVTALRVYENMAMKSLEIPKSNETSGGLFFTATFREIEIVVNTRSSVRVAVPRAQRKVTTAKATAPANSKIVERRVMAGTGASRPWFDPDIDEWRFDAIYNSTKGNWEFHKNGLLDGFTASTDQEYRDYIAKKRAADVAHLPTVDKKTKKITDNTGGSFQVVGDNPAVWKTPPIKDPPESLRP